MSILRDIFKKSGLKLLGVNTNLANTHAPFKVDLRISTKIAGNWYDVGVVEFAPSFASTKAKNGKCKLILESKEIVNCCFASVMSSPVS
jgi:hypothetical protein